MTPPSQPPLKSFDLERALAGDPVVTRNGRKIIRLAHFPEADPGFRIYALIAGEDFPLSYYENGMRNTDEITTGYDLFMASKTMFARVTKLPGQHPFITSAFNTREEAEAPNPGYQILPAIEYED